MKSYTITVNGVAYQVTVEENTNGAPAAPAVQAAPVTAPAASAPVAAVGSIKVEAPMPGTILDIKVAAGDRVASGQSLLVLEAMKMENEIFAPSDGTVASVNVNKGDTVEAGKVLITLN